jgi:hypothetical protein
MFDLSPAAQAILPELLVAGSAKKNRGGKRSKLVQTLFGELRRRVGNRPMWLRARVFSLNIMILIVFL